MNKLIKFKLKYDGIPIYEGKLNKIEELDKIVEDLKLKLR